MLPTHSRMPARQLPLRDARQANISALVRTVRLGSTQLLLRSKSQRLYGGFGAAGIPAPGSCRARFSCGSAHAWSALAKCTSLVRNSDAHCFVKDGGQRGGAACRQVSAAKFLM